VNVAEAARSLYAHCVAIGIDRLGYPGRQQELRSIDDALGLPDDQVGRTEPK